MSVTAGGALDFVSPQPLFSSVQLSTLMDTIKTTSGPPMDDLVEVRKPTSLLIAQFFLFPLIIIGICVGIFLLFGYITYEQRGPSEYLADIQNGTGSTRWL